MPLVSMKEMLIDAKENGYAVGQYNLNNLEFTQAILEASQEENAPVILGVSEGAARYMSGFYTVVKMVEGLMHDLNITVPVAIHLDHGSSFEKCKEAIDAGFTSVMIDASHSPFEENVEITSKVVEYAHERGVSVEAELGTVGGPYKGEPKLGFKEMEEIGASTGLPLVLHGGTGIPTKDIQKAIPYGTAKINVNTENQIASAKAVRDVLNNDSEVYDPRKYLGPAREAIKATVKGKIKESGTSNRAK